MTNVVVSGVAGRMGQRLANLTIASGDLELVGGTEYPGHQAIGRDIGEVIGNRHLDLAVVDSLGDALDEAEVVTVFTSPEATLNDAAVCAERGVGMVVGTTGFTDEQLGEFNYESIPN